MSRFPVPFLSPLGSAVAVAFNALKGLKTAWDRRRVIGQLAGLNDYMLRDIGITRHDVMSALAEPLYRDPSESLAARAAEARQARRASAISAYEWSEVSAPAPRRAA